jgi:hypothetical protein
MEATKRKIPTVEQVLDDNVRQAERDLNAQKALVRTNGAPPPTVPVAALDGADAYLNRNPSSMIVGRRIEFDGKAGRFRYADDDSEVSDEIDFVMLADNVWCGWRRFFGEGMPPEHAGGLLFDEGFRRPARDELGDTDPTLWEIGKFGDTPRDPWEEVVYCPLENRESGEVVTLVCRTRTSINAIDGALRHYTQMRRREADQYPVLRLRVGKYEHRKFGILPKPQFGIVGKAPKASAAKPDTSSAAALNDEVPF